MIMENAAPCVFVGLMLERKYKRLFWDPCVAHCINNLLMTIGDLLVYRNTLRTRRKLYSFTIIVGCLIS